MIRDIIKEPDPRLHQACADAVPSDETTALLFDLIETCQAKGGLGIAAPQVGVMVRACICVNPETKKAVALLNPRIVKRSPHKVKWTEGCLSSPREDARVATRRAYSVVVEAIDAAGKKVRIEAREAFACVLQHEIDHLQGKTIFDELAETGTQRILAAAS